MKPYSPHLAILDRIKNDSASELLRKHQINCETGNWLDSAVLKLQKKEWTDGGIGQGVFFSVWIGEEELKKKRFNYNIHAFKLRLRKGYSIKAIEFASAFRARLEALGGQWPNMSIDYGPQTLMQGWIHADLTTFRRDVLKLMDSFVAIHKVIDELFEERMTNKSALPAAGEP
jgi:hypothetical protein